MAAGLTVDLRNYRDFLAQVQKVDQTIDSIDSTIVRLGQAFDRLEDYFRKASVEAKDLLSNFRDISKTTSTAANDLDKVAQETKDAASGLDKVGTEAKDAADGLAKVDTEAKDAAGGLDQLGKEAVQTDGALEQVGEAAEDMGVKTSRGANSSHSSLSSFFSGVMGYAPQVVMAIGTIVTAVAGLAAGMILHSNTAFIAWEDAFAGVVKTVNATDGELATLEDQLRDMASSSTNPVAGLENAHITLAGIMEQAGQLGVPTKNLAEFTEQIAMLKMAAPSLGDDASMSLAQFANITQMDFSNIDNLVATIVGLGNTSATQENVIVEFMMRLAAAGNQAGMTEAQITGLSAALASLGLNPEAGGSAMSMTLAEMTKAVGTYKVTTVTAAEQEAAAKNNLIGLEEDHAAAVRKVAEAQDMLNRITEDTSLKTRNARMDDYNEAVADLADIEAKMGKATSGTGKFMDKEVEEWGESLDIFSEVAGVSAAEFAKAWGEDSVKALNMFAIGLSKMDEAARYNALEYLELDGLRVADTLLRIAGAVDKTNSTIENGTTFWEANNAQVAEASKRFDTTQSKINAVKNKFNDLSITIGEAVNPVFRALLQEVANFLDVANTGLSDFFVSIGIMSREAAPETAVMTQEFDNQNQLLAEREGLLANIRTQQEGLAEATASTDKYTVQAGDSLWALAQQWGTTVDEIMQANPEIKKASFIRIGTEIVNPVAGADSAFANTSAEISALNSQMKLAQADMDAFGTSAANTGTKVDDTKTKVSDLNLAFGDMSIDTVQSKLLDLAGQVGETIGSPEFQTGITNLKDFASAVGQFSSMLFATLILGSLSLGIDAVSAALDVAKPAIEAANPILAELTSEIEGLTDTFDNLSEEDKENIQSLFEFLSRSAVGAGMTALAVGLLALSPAFMLFKGALNAVEPALETMSTLGELIQDIQDGDTDDVVDDLINLSLAWTDLQNAFLLGMADGAADVIQFFADLAGVGDEVQQALDAFELIPTIITGISFKLQLGFAEMKQSIVYGINDFLGTINDFLANINSLPDWVKDAAGINEDTFQIGLKDTSGVDAAVVEKKAAMDLFAIGREDIITNAKEEGEAGVQAYADGIIEALNDPTLDAQMRGQLMSVLANLWGEEDISGVMPDLSLEQIYGEDLLNNIQSLPIPIQFSTEADGMLDFSEIEKQLDMALANGNLTDEEKIITINAKLQMQGLNGEDMALDDESFFTLWGMDPNFQMDLTQFLPEDAPLLGIYDQMATDATTAGENVQTGLAQGITDNQETANQAATDAATAVLAAFTATMGIQSPSTVMEGYGDDLMMGLVNGLLFNTSLPTAILTMTTYFNLIPQRIMQMMVQANVGFSQMGSDAQTLAGRIAGVSVQMVGSLNQITAAAQQALSVLNQLATKAGITMDAAGAQVVNSIPGRADGGYITAGSLYQVTEPSTGGVELFRSGADTFMISNRSGQIIPPTTAPITNNTYGGSPSIVFSPSIVVGANAGVTEEQVGGLLNDAFDRFLNSEPVQMRTERAGL